jgi:hypothetical protein
MVEKHSCPIAEPQGRQQNLPDPYTGRVLTNVSFGVAGMGMGVSPSQ